MRRIAVTAALFAIFASFYAATFSFREITDTRLNSLQTRALVLHGDIDLTRYGDRAPPKAFVRKHDGSTYAVYGVGLSVLASPFYAVVARLTSREVVAQGIVAVFFAAASAVAMWWLLRGLFDERWIAVAGTVAFAFGTTMWPLAATAFYAHGEVALLQILGLHALFSRRSDAPFWAGLALAGSVFVRPAAFPLAAAAGVYFLVKGWRTTWRYALGCAAPVAGLLVQNRWIWGDWLTTGYSFSGVGFHGNVPADLWHLLFGWWRGLFVYSPVLLAGVAGFVITLRRIREEVPQRLVVAGAGALGSFLLYARFTTWWAGGAQFGYRYLLEAVPSLILLAAYAAQRSRILRLAAMWLGVVSVLTCTFGAVPYKWGYDFVLFPRGFTGSPLGQAWIVNLHHPLGAVLRLAGVGAVAAVLASIGRKRVAAPALA